MQTLLPQPGRECSFFYPRHNFYGVLSKMEPRRVLVTAVRDLEQQPLERITFDLQPLLKRSQWLVIGQDLDKQAERSFYVGSMRDIQEVEP